MHAALDFGDEGCRTYQRLESFLKRYLQSGSNEIRRAEPCIVVGKQFKQAFKFLVLAGPSLLILQNPPKYFKDIELTIQLDKIRSLEQVHDIPDFINGELKGKAQHFSLNYKLSADSKVLLQDASKDSKVSLKDSPRTSAWYSHYDGGTSKQNFVSPQSSINSNVVTFKDNFLSAEKSFSRAYSDSRLPEYETNSKSNLQSGLSSSIGGLSSAGLGRRPLPKPLPGTENITASNCLIKIQSKDRRKHTLHGDNRSSDLDNSGSHKKETLGYITYKHDSIHKGIGKEPCLKNFSSQEISPVPRTLDPKVKDLQLSQSSSSSLGSSMSEKILGFLKGSKPNNSKSVNQPLDSSMSVTGDKSANDTEKLNGSDSIAELEKEETLDIYLLIEGSPFFQHIHSTWISSLLNTNMSARLSGGQLQHIDESRVLGLFNDLKGDIFDCEDTEGSFLLVQELSTSCDKYFFLKRLVWKSPELIEHFIEALKRNMKLQSGISQRTRADQIDYMIAIADLLVKVVRGTEHLRTRNKALHEKGGSLTRKLCVLCCQQPQTSSDPLALTKNVSEGAALLLSQSFQMLRDMRDSDEIVSLLKDWGQSATNLLFEIFRAVDQATWCLHSERALTLTDLVSLIEQERETITYLDSLIENILECITQRKSQVEGSKVVSQLYQKYYVLKILLHQSAHFLDYVHQTYYEEIRYYVQSSLSEEWLPEHGLTPLLTSLMDEVNLKIINGSG